MLRLKHLLGAALVVVACAEPTSTSFGKMSGEATLSASSSTSHVSVPLGFNVWVPCANGGAGESVALSGRLSITDHVTYDANGGVHMRTHVRPDGVTGVGLVSGARYNGTGGTISSEHYAAGGFPAGWSLVNNFRIIGQGPGNNLLVHSTLHQSVNANGEVMASVDLHGAECR